MNSATITIASGAIQTRITAALSRLRPRAAAVQPTRSEPRVAQLDRHVLKDIGVEPGSITWL